MRLRPTVLTWGILAAALAAAGWEPRVQAQRSAPKSVDWPLHNLDLAGQRYSAMEQITRANVKTLTPR